MTDDRPLKIKKSITLDEDVYNKIRALATNDDRSISQYINLILRKHIKDKSR